MLLCATVPRNGAPKVMTDAISAGRCAAIARDNSSQTVSDQMNLPPGLSQGLLNRVIQLASDEEVGTLGVEAYS
jgi:hypothetical protein